MGKPFRENMGEEKHTLSARHCFCLDNSRAGHGGWKQLRYWFSFFPHHNAPKLFTMNTQNIKANEEARIVFIHLS